MMIVKGQVSPGIRSRAGKGRACLEDEQDIDTEAHSQSFGIGLNEGSVEREVSFCR
jgi:hypothetical protein